MNIERENTGTQTAMLRVRLAPEDYATAVEKALKEQRRNASWPGFRPGQVPMSIVKKRVGKTVLVNEVERLVSAELNGYIEQNKLRLLGQPLPRNEAAANDWEQPGNFEFTYEMGLAPEVDIELGGKMNVNYPVVQVDDELVNKEVADMRRRYGRLEDAEQSGPTDMLLGDMIELNEDGSIKEGGIFQRTTISLEFLKDEATRTALLGKARGDEVQVDPHKVSDGHDDLARMLNVDHERVHDLKGPMLLRIAEVKRLVPAEVDKAMFDRAFGADQVPDEAAFRDRVRQAIDGRFRRESDRLFKMLVMDGLMQRNSVELPDEFLKRWILETSERPVTAEEVEESYSSYAEGLKRQLVEERVVEKYGLEAKNDELAAFAQRHVADQFAQYGIPVPEDAKLVDMARRMLSDRDQVRRMRDAIVDHKLMVHFKTLLDPKEEKMTYDQFVNLARSVRS